MKNKVLVWLMAFVFVFMSSSCKPSATGDETTLSEQSTDSTETEIGSHPYDAIKLDATKDIVYDADYPADVDQEFYYAPVPENGEPIAVKNIVVPYINIDSEDAQAANEDLHERYNRYIESYKEGLKELNQWSNATKYKYIQNDSILSVVVGRCFGKWDRHYFSAFTYNFDLSTGKRLTLDEAIAMKEISDFPKIAEKLVLEDSFFGLNKDFDYEKKAEDKNKTIGELREAIAEDKLDFFFNERNKLCFYSRTYNSILGDGSEQDLFVVNP